MSKPLTPKARSLALAVAAGKSIRAAARKLDIAERTAYRMSALPEFKELVGELQAQVVSRAVAKLATGTAKAAACLLELLGSTDERVKLRAARAVLERYPELHMYSDLSGRLVQLQKDKNEKVRKTRKGR